MGDQRKRGIAWTDMTWNPVRGCSRISPGCGGPGPHGGCYAEAQALRVYRCDRGRGVPIGSGSYDGLVMMVGGRDCPSCIAQGQPSSDERGEWWCPTCIGLGRVDGEARWTGGVRLAPSALDAPLRMRAPKRIFVNSMSDLFHERLSALSIARVFDVMQRAHWHTFQVLTKRAERMKEFCSWAAENGMGPLPNVWLGVSVEDQQRADERIPHLLATPAATRFLSVEPMLGPVQLGVGDCFFDYGVGGHGRSGIDLVICGGESGKQARPCDVAWVRSLRDQCRAAGVATFVKQLGARSTNSSEDVGPWPVAPATDIRWKDSHGGDPAEWPEDLRVRELPATIASSTTEDAQPHRRKSRRSVPIETNGAATVPLHRGRSRRSRGAA